MENEELIQTIINCQDIEGYIKEQKNKLVIQVTLWTCYIIKLTAGYF